MDSFSDELDQRGTILASQLACIGVLLVAGIGLAIIEYFFPSFFSYSYLKWGGWESVGRYWPFFLYGGIMSFISCFGRASLQASEKRQIFGLGIVTSILAGVWEEIAYRWIFICYAMIIIMVTNLIFGSVLGWIATAVLGGAAIYCFMERKIVAMIFCVLGAVCAVWLALHVNPVYLFYDYVLVPVINLTTLHEMKPILYGNYGKLFIFGAIAANAWFRNGHKYQGPFGLVNSWYAGMALLYATLTYGLWTAVVVHALYDIEFHAVRFVFSKTAAPRKTDRGANRAYDEEPEYAGRN
ncbi:MAG TPA: hypothetical protein VFT82_02280 [Candidatus Paceibacterota bacterium]|nr:hypothetical protein [Candidatus Paceibacterota bacterium]